ncbi:hypothetical protein Ae707Ps1_0558 [Pseudonocardia sp. Ae707_Ps1]|nr:hypothetical protein Ae707Ps1_0558 [Pseudonocardia sp. Ae707_Ps1]
MRRGLARRTVIGATTVVTASVLAVSGGGLALADGVSGAPPATPPVSGAPVPGAPPAAGADTPDPEPGGLGPVPASGSALRSSSGTAEADPPPGPDSGPPADADPAPRAAPGPEEPEPVGDPAGGPGQGPARAAEPVDPADPAPAADPADPAGPAGPAEEPAGAPPERPAGPAERPGGPADEPADPADPAKDPAGPAAPAEEPSGPGAGPAGPGEDPGDPAADPTDPAAGPAEDPAGTPAEDPADGPDPSARPADQSVPKPGAPTAAERFGWGTPLPASDEFDYTGRPDPERWNHPGECWPGHDGNGGRCLSRSTVDGEKLVQTGLRNGDSAWISSKFNQQYGRWEARVRSEANGPDNGRQYHPLLIIWPQSDRWPQDGEYDFLENGAPGEQCAEAFIHYPHGRGAIQQEFVRETDCGEPLSEWHNVAVEWTPDHIKGFIDGEEWFSFSGGAQAGRRAIQDMPSGHLTIQLDNFFGGDMQPATYEVDWVRIYDLDDD